jgi:hypothetical protein
VTSLPPSQHKTLRNEAGRESGWLNADNREYVEGLPWESLLRTNPLG